jgi:hypothetical protein
MLTKNSEAVSAAVPQQLRRRLAKLAKIPDSKANQFLGAVDEKIMVPWLRDIFLDPHMPAVTGACREISDAAIKLLRLLQALEDERGRELPGDLLAPWKREHVLHFAAIGLKMQLRRTGTISTSDMLSSLPVLASAAKSAWRMNRSETRVGRPQRIKGYPGLNVLVFTLERSACLAGGGFTVNKRDRKGSLLDALDLLRANFLDRPDGTLLPDAQLLPGVSGISTHRLGLLLPPLDRHPVSTYQRIMGGARGPLSE